MTTVKHRASTILNAFEEVQSELIGKAVILTDGKAGTAEAIWLDELHGLRNLYQRPRWKVAYRDHQIHTEVVARTSDRRSSASNCLRGLPCCSITSACGASTTRFCCKLTIEIEALTNERSD